MTSEPSRGGHGLGRVGVIFTWPPCGHFNVDIVVNGRKFGLEPEFCGMDWTPRNLRLTIKDAAIAGETKDSVTVASVGHPLKTESQNESHRNSENFNLAL